jgi:predicted  nucleic acid-binding Zn-ribbon protein
MATDDPPAAIEGRDTDQEPEGGDEQQRAAPSDPKAAVSAEKSDRVTDAFDAITEARRKADQLVQELQRLKAQADSSVGDVQTAKGTVETITKLVQDRKDKVESVATQASELQASIEEANDAIASMKQAAASAAKAIDKAKEAVEANNSAIQTHKGSADSAAANLQSIAAEAAISSAAVHTAKDTATGLLKEIQQAHGTVNQHAQDSHKAKEEIEATTSKLNEWRSGAKDSFKAIAQQKADAENEVGSIKDLVQQATERHNEAREQTSKIDDLHKRIVHLADQAAQLKNTIEGDSTTTAELAERADGVTETLNKHEADLKNLLAQYKEHYNQLEKQIEDLLPGATSAGLASSFQDRKKTFRGPKVWWLRAFASCLLLLFSGALVEFFYQLIHKTTPTSWDGVLLHLLVRAPIVFPLIWFALYAARQLTIAMRLEEDYAFKESISKAFEGYRRQMENISGEIHGEPPVVKLSSAVIDTLSSSPDRIYDKKGLHGSPLSHVADVVKDSQDVVKAATDVQPPTRTT